MFVHELEEFIERRRDPFGQIHSGFQVKLNERFMVTAVCRFSENLDSLWRIEKELVPPILQFL